MKKVAIALNIKAVSDDARQIEGWATRPDEDRVGDIVMPKGAIFSLPLPFLLDHDHKQAVGEVDRVEVTDKGIKFWAHIKNIAEPGEVKDLCDKAWSLVKNGLRKAVSIGFAAKECDLLPTGGYRFTAWEWLELSAVTVPAQGGALITGIKSLSPGEMVETVSVDETKFDTNAPAATGTIERPADVRPGASGKSTKPVNLNPRKGTVMKTVAEQIAALEASRQAKAARMAEVMQKSIDEGRSSDQAEQEEFDTLEQDVAAIDGDLKRLRALEKAQALTAKPVVANQIKTSEDGTNVRAGVTIKAPAPEKGIRFARVAKCIGLAHKTHRDPIAIAEERYKDDPVIAAVVKAAVSAANTGNATWAGNLVGDETSVFADFVEFLRPQTILGRFGANNVPSLRRVPFRVPLIAQTSGGSGYWVGEGAAKPLTKFDFSRTTLEPLKVANIAVVTMEVLRDSSPSAETIVRDQLAAALRERLDIDFIDPAKAASAGVSPASILNGVAGIPSSGNTADDVREDIRTLFGAFIAANNAPTSGVWIMPATTALALSLMQNPLGQAEFPGISMTGGTLFGLPVIVSEYVTSDSDGAVVALINASDIYLADDGDVNVDMSTEASLQMDNAPTHNSTTPTAAQLVSLWQTNSVGFRAERTVNWARRRAAAVAYLTGVNWGAPASGS